MCTGRSRGGPAPVGRTYGPVVTPPFRADSVAAVDDAPDDVDWLLESQAGVASALQLRSRGVSDGRTRAQIRAGRWQRAHPRVIVAFSGPLPYLARAWAGVLWAGSGTMASHVTAGFLSGLTDREPALVHVAVPEHRRLSAPAGLVVHRTSNPDPDSRRRPPQTTVERCALDLAGCATTLDGAIAAVANALQRRLTTEARLLSALERTPSLRWRQPIAELLTPALAGIRSPLEWRYARDVERAHGLPAGRRQSRGPDLGASATWRDVVYSSVGVVVELDGRVGHTEGHEFRDMARDNRTTELGELTLRYGSADVMSRPCSVARQVAQVLRIRGWLGTPKRCGPGCSIA
jgi:hypothetical protein